MLPDRTAFTEADLPAATGLGSVFWSDQIRSGALKAHQAGGRTIVLRKDLEVFLASLPQVVATSAPDENARIAALNEKLSRGRKLVEQLRQPAEDPARARGRLAADRLLGKAKR